MLLQQDVPRDSSQRIIYDHLPAPVSTEIITWLALDKKIEMASNRGPRYMQQILAWLTATTAAQPLLSVPSSVPSNASGVVDPNFAGFAFEQASLWNYALDADGNANGFSINLIAAITDRTGGKPLIRLGGTSYVSLCLGGYKP